MVLKYNYLRPGGYVFALVCFLVSLAVSMIIQQEVKVI